MARLTAPNGTAVEVADDKVDELTRRGFTAESTKTSTKKATSSKSSKS